MIKRFIYSLLTLLVAGNGLLHAQTPVASPKRKTIAPNKIFNFQFHYTYQLPGGDLLDRYKQMHGVGAGLLFKTTKNVVFSLDGVYQFGSSLQNDNMLGNLTNSSGVITNGSGYAADYSQGMRGIMLFGKAGKIFPLSPYNRNSGLLLMGGAGFYSHKINIVVPHNDVPALSDDMLKGYDRLSMGFALSETVGYYFHSYNRFINFYVGFDLVQAFTHNVRGYNYDQMAFDKGNRTDLVYGLRFAWMIPVYLSGKDEDEFQYR